MKRPGLGGALIHGVLLVVALGVAWWDWTRDDGPDDDKVLVWELDPADVRGVDVETEDVSVTLELRPDDAGGERFPWFEVERTEPARPGVGDEDPAAAEAGPSRQAFRGSPRTADRIEALARLEADRALGVLAADKLEQLGLAPPAGSLALRTTGATRSLEIGETATGRRLRYVRVPASGEVYVIQTSLVTDLEDADRRLVNRDLHAFAGKDLAEIQVTIGKATRRFVQRERESPGKAHWAAAETPGQRDDRITSWMERVGRLTVERYLAEGESPLAAPSALAAAVEAARAESIRSAGGEPAADGQGASGETSEAGVPAPETREPLVRVEYHPAEGPAGYLELERYTGGEGGDVAYVATTEHTRGRVVVNRFFAEEIDKDLADLFEML